MLEKQSLDEFLSNIDKGKAVIVSLSPQSRASLAVHFGLTPLQVIYIDGFNFQLLVVDCPDRNDSLLKFMIPMYNFSNYFRLRPKT